MRDYRSNFALTYDSKQKYIYVFGGVTHGYNLNKCEKYSVELDKWTAISPMTQEKINASACIMNNKFIYVFGKQGRS